MGESTPAQRQNWKRYECKEHDMIVIAFGPDQIRIAPPTIDAWRALALVLQAHGYDIRVKDTDSYNCRKITGGNEKSLHAFGIALDINWTTNPFMQTPDQRPVRFSSKPTQAQRAQDVKLHLADTDMSQAMITDCLAIMTNNGKRVFEWGGNWKSVKDAMHFELDVGPEDLATGINWTTVKGGATGLPVPADRVEPDVDDDDAGARGALELEEGLGVGARGVEVQALQEALSRLNYHLGARDGVFGSLTQAALLAFQADNNLPTTGIADSATRAALLIAGPRPVSGERAHADAETLRQKGSKMIELADWLKKVAAGTGILGVLGVSDAQVQVVDRVTGGLRFLLTGVPPVPPGTGAATAAGAGAAVGAGAAAGAGTAAGAAAGAAVPAAGTAATGGALDGLAPVFDIAKLLLGTQSGLGVLAVGAGVLLWRNANQIIQRRVEEHRDSSNIGR